MTGGPHAPPWPPLCKGVSRGPRHVTGKPCRTRAHPGGRAHPCSLPQGSDLFWSPVTRGTVPAQSPAGGGGRRRRDCPRRPGRLPAVAQGLCALGSSRLEGKPGPPVTPESTEVAQGRPERPCLPWTQTLWGRGRRPCASLSAYFLLFPPMTAGAGKNSHCPRVALADGPPGRLPGTRGGQGWPAQSCTAPRAP